MSDMLEIYKNENESLKNQIDVLKKRNTILFKKNKNLVREKLRFKKTIRILKLEQKDESWDLLDDNEINGLK